MFEIKYTSNLALCLCNDPHFLTCMLRKVKYYGDFHCTSKGLHVPGIGGQY